MLHFIGLIQLLVVGWVSCYSIINAGLTEIPSDIPSDTTSLTLSSNSITAITILDDYAPSLLDLDLRDNFISEITPGVFSDCSSLTKLDLSKNNISILHNDTFQGLSSLTTLSITHGAIEMTIKEAAFNGLTSLTKLAMQKTPLVATPCHGPYMPNLEEYNGFSTINELESLTDRCFMALTQLKHFVMQGNPYTHLGFVEYKFPENIETINLAATSVPEYGECLLNAVHLKLLKLHGTGIIRFPLLGFIDTVVKIIMYGNQIECLGIGELQRFPYASLIKYDSNKLPSFPVLHRNCTNTPLPNTDLSQLFLLPNLTVLDLEKNRITSFPSRIYAPKLMDLDLYKNRISYLNASMLLAFPALVTLDLSDNLLVTLDMTHEASPPAGLLPYLLTLNLNSNDLTTIHDLSLVSSSIANGNAEVDLSDNPLVCDNLMCWLLKYPTFTFGTATCASPALLAGRSLESVTEEELNCGLGNLH